MEQDKNDSQQQSVTLPVRLQAQMEDQLSLSRSVSPLTISTPGIIPLTGILAAGKSRTKASSVQNARKLDLQIEMHLQRRAGSVLNHRSMLKVDQYPLKQRDPPLNISVLPISISGANNLRQSPASRVYGVAQPTIHGIRGILNILRCGREHAPVSAGSGAGAGAGAGGVGSPGSKSGGQEEVLWINMREEPILFINGRCIVLREKDEPFRNMTALKGISKERIEALEWRLKEDVVAEASLNSGNIMLHKEVKKRKIQACWEAVPLDQIKTTEEVFFQFRMEGYKVKYYRWPTTPEESPSKKLFDLLLSCIMESPETTNIVFNCQTGRGRSTFGMVAARLVQMWRGPETLKTSSGISKRRRSSIKIAGTFQPLRTEEEVKQKAIPRVLSGHSLKSIEAQLDIDIDTEDARSALTTQRSAMDDTSRSLLAGWYQPVLQVIRLLPNGRAAKGHVDHFIDECTHLVNLRELVFRFRKKATLRPNEAKIFRFQTMRAGTALIRYILLILFDAYLCEQVQEFLAPAKNPSTRPPSTLFNRTFESWVDNRPGIIQILNEIQRNPQAALESISFASLPFEISSKVGEDQRKVIEAIASRRGSMLNTDTILKLDHYPGAESAMARGTSDTGVEIHGAANFRTVRNTRLSGVCTPTLEAAFRMFRYIANEHKAVSKIVWSNLREEPLVYINKRPFSLRSIGKPFRNVDTFSDIGPKHLEAAEDRLKKDVLTEAGQYQGRVLVHVETEARELQSVWEDVCGADDVLTPRELYEYVKDAQLDIDYARLPIYPERAPSPEDVDSLIARVRKFKTDASAHFLFNCQMGRGRSTMAMIIAFLELLPTGTNNNTSVLSLTSADKAVSIEVDEEMDAFGDSLPHADKDEDTNDSSSIDSGDGNTAGAKRTEPEYTVILSLVRVLRNGVSAKRWADRVIDRCGTVENIRSSVEVYAQRAAKARTQEQSEDYLQRALVFLRRYFIVITIAAYEGEYFNELTTKSYSAWYRSRPELTTLFGQIVDKRSIQAAALDSVLTAPPNEANEFEAIKEEQETEQAGKMQEILEYVASRSGTVLIRGSIVKSDHFPGCNRIKNAELSIDGAPNLRQVPFTSKTKSDGWNVHGTGIPTVAGLKKLLDHLVATDKERGIMATEVCWINLREEPILYINGRPFVLRKLEHPFGNLEHTGISRERVENMEARLKLDVIQEIIENGDGRFLLHDEDDIGLTPAWETVDISPGSTALLTPTELYEHLRQEGYNVRCFRVPITDEQAPKLSDYDKLFNIVSGVSDDAKIVVNCQMGRGRTTTGLVVVLAVMLWQHRELEEVITSVTELAEAGHKFRSKLRGKSQDGRTSEELTYLKGEFKAALTCTTVLDGGMKAKGIADGVIDLCDTMQNIREAIYDLKLTCEKHNLSALQLAASQGRGAHYVIRYCQLIQFVAYLLSMDPNTVAVKPMQSFLDWVQERPEVRNATRNASFPP